MKSLPGIAVYKHFVFISKMATSLLLFLIIFSATFAHCEVKVVRGVDIKHQSFYDPSKDFTCFDGSKTIPFSSVNDDYCDCHDGTDEPGTSACPEGKFFCANIGFQPLYLQSSRVNDGICDCCDGSDEYDSSVACFNECQKHGAEAREKQKEALAEANAGFEIKLDYIKTGKEKMVEKQTKLDTINGLLEERREKLEELRTVKEAAEAPEKEAKDKHQKEWDEVQAKLKEERETVERNEAFTLLDTDKDGWVTIGELMSHHHLEADMSENEAKDFLGGEAMVDTEGFNKAWTNIKPKFLKDGRKEPTESEESTAKTSDEQTSTDEVDTTTEEGDEPVNDGVEKPVDEPAKEDEMPDYDDATKQLIEAADAARRSFDEIDKEVRDLESQKRENEEYVKLDFGKDHEFSALKGECFEYTDREYTYKLCPFDKVSQRNKDGGSETDLGRWGQWSGHDNAKYSRMKYEGGQGCWNGPARSTVVNLSCGKDNAVLTVSEPSRCEYEMDFKTPAFCEKVEHVHTEL
ncbi:glucosidase 2 subunit beta-like isoform X2 [Hydractinia symbiolongicarpus]|uniref:glucosidase 2 subunit beta-like isoform X2 n=1 Tax=Hydractinia symbiolongicarpus TaxID=13093 RepID=UPI00254B5189|nr:glucosidase 2 subunit beta-like isoform X2 [Hydractinia symbiolongicarpus]